MYYRLSKSTFRIMADRNEPDLPPKSQCEPSRLHYRGSCSSISEEPPQSLGKHRYSLWAILIVGALGYFQIGSNAWLVCCCFAIVATEFFKQVDRGVPLMQVTALLACLQWLVGAALSYHTSSLESQHFMLVDETTYFRFAIPGWSAFALGLLAAGPDIHVAEILRDVKDTGFFFTGCVLNVVALCGDIGSRFVPEKFLFAFFLVSQARYVGAIYFLYSRHSWRYVMVIVSMLPLFRTTQQSGFFHDMLIWSGFVLCYWFSLRSRRPLQKAAILASAVLLAFTMQGIKQTFRSKVWEGERASLLGEALGFLRNYATLNKDEIFDATLTRLNQGRLVSAVMGHVPSIEAYAEGDTVRDAIIASIMPRALYPQKVKAGGRELFTRFTGWTLNESTSMNISILGEGYANFGRGGGIVFMGLVGVVLALGFQGCIRLSQKYPVFVFWIPLVFYQAVKAETDLSEVLNQVTKGACMAVFLYFLIWRLSAEKDTVRQTPMPSAGRYAGVRSRRTTSRRPGRPSASSGR
jgi:hypothetical protein